MFTETVRLIRDGVKAEGMEVGGAFIMCCFTSTEARWPIRDGDSGKGTTE